MNPKKFNVYDKVWVMRGDAPSKRLVFAVIESMSFSKLGVELSYRLVGSRIGAGWGDNDSGERYPSKEVFATREELIASL